MGECERFDLVAFSQLSAALPVPPAAQNMRGAAYSPSPSSNLRLFAAVLTMVTVGSIQSTHGHTVSKLTRSGSGTNFVLSISHCISPRRRSSTISRWIPTLLLSAHG